MKKSIILFFLLYIIGIAHAQTLNYNLPQITPASPEAAALAKYINFPVNYGTGLPEISIPLYEIKAGTLTLPISLSYHASGLKVHESSGWIGSGWSLQAEPSITRSIKGAPDETGYLRWNWSGTINNEYYAYLADGLGDEEPDEFYYSLLSKSGGFYFKKPLQSNSPYEIIPHPYEPVKIEFNHLQAKKFEIRDENGVRHRFGTSLNNEEALEYYGININVWKATEVISSTGRDSIFFKYHNPGYEYPYQDRDMITVEDNSKHWNGLVYPPGCPGQFGAMAFVTNKIGETSTTFELNTAGELNLSPPRCWSYPVSSQSDLITKRISEISFTGGKVVFEKSYLTSLPGGKTTFSLDAIKVYNTAGLIRQIKLFRQGDPFTGSRLDSIQILDANGIVTERYNFGYDPTAMPSRFITKDFDYWGYYNGAGNDPGKSSLPVMQVTSYPTLGGNPVTFQIGAANREPNENYAGAGMLTKITYPSGGSTTFTYEGNKYWSQIGATRIKKQGPGLRIKKIVDHDPVANKNIVRIFKYGEGEDDAGFIKRPFSLDDFMCKKQNHYRTSQEDYKTDLRIFYANSLFDLFYSNGAPVVYPEVTEYKRESLFDNVPVVTLGKTVYKYNYQNYRYPTLMQPFPNTTLKPDPRADWIFGDLESQKEYKWVSNQYELIKNQRFVTTYTLNPNTIPIGQVYRKINLNSPYLDYRDEDIIYYPYNLVTGAKRLVIDSTILKEGSDSIITKTNYTYGNPLTLLPTETRSLASDGQYIITNNKYVHDLTLTGASETGRQKLLADWRVATLLQQSNSRNGRSEDVKIEYNVFNDIAQIASVKANTGPGNTEETRLKYHSYDAAGNVLSVSKEQGHLISYIWGYQKQYPVAEVKNASDKDIFYESFEESQGADIPVNDGRTGSRSKLNGFSKTLSGLRNGIYTLTYWKKNGSQWSLTVVNNIAVSNNSYQITLTGQLDDIRFHPQDAQMKTYTYTSMIGITSETDANNKTIFYEYDSFNRLRLIRDQDKNIIKIFEYQYQSPALQ